MAKPSYILKKQSDVLIASLLVAMHLMNVSHTLSYYELFAFNVLVGQTVLPPAWQPDHDRQCGEGAKELYKECCRVVSISNLLEVSL